MKLYIFQDNEGQCFAFTKDEVRRMTGMNSPNHPVFGLRYNVGYNEKWLQRKETWFSIVIVKIASWFFRFHGWLNKL